MPTDIYGNNIISEDENSYTVDRGGVPVTVAKTPETSNFVQAPPPEVAPTQESSLPFDGTQFMPDWVPNPATGIVQGAKMIGQSLSGGPSPEELAQNQDYYSRLPQDQVVQSEGFDTAAPPPEGSTAPLPVVSEELNPPPQPQMEPPSPQPASPISSNTIGGDASKLYNEITQQEKNAKKYYEDSQKGIEEAVKPLKAQANTAEEEFKRRSQDYEKAQQELSTMKVDPEHYWADKTTGDRVLAGLAVFLGGIGAGLTKTPNYAAQIIDSAIQRDIDAQKANLGVKESAVKTAGSMLSFYNERLKDANSAVIATEKAMNDKVINYINNIANNTQNNNTKARLLEVGATLQAKSDALGSKMQEQLMRQAFMTADPMTLDPDKIPFDDLRQLYVKSAPRQMVYTKSNGETVRFNLPGSAGFAYNMEDAKKARNIIGEQQTFNNLAQQLIQFKKDINLGVLSKTDRRALEYGRSLSDQLLTTYRTLDQTGVPQQFEIKIITEKFGGDPGEWSIDNILANTARLEGGLKVQNEAAESRLKALLSPRARVNVMTPNQAGQQGSGLQTFKPLKK